ncbi:MAG: tripartite tricarboxylate transporter substrate binding protein [Peptostreptococcales bacterium]|jgi:tripartite-type tricarboxylate transporter receptor subunit TctC
MSMKRKKLFSRIGVMLIMILLFTACSAPANQENTGQQKENVFPEKPIRIIITKSIGGSVDSAIRAIQPFLEKELGTSITLENITDGGGRVASEMVMNAAPDGYTLLVAPFPSAIVGELMYDGKVDFNQMTPIFNISLMYQSVTVKGDSQINTFDDLLELSKTKKLTMAGSGGMGSNASIVQLKLKDIGIKDLAMIPYPGSPEVTAAVMGGHNDISSGATSGKEWFIQDKALKAIAVCAPERLPDLPDVPTFVELGYPNFVVPLTSSIVGPPDMNPEVVKILEEALYKVIEMPEVTEAAEKMTVTINPLDSEGLKELIQSNTELVEELLPKLLEEVK